MNVRTVLLQAIHFSISTQFSFIWPIDRTLSGATTPRQSGPGSDDNEEELQHYWNHTIRLFRVISRAHLGEILPLAEMQSVYFTVSVDWVTGHMLGETYHSAEMQPVHSAALADWATGHLLGESNHSAEMQSVYSTASADWDTRHLLGESYPSAEMLLVYSTAPPQPTEQTRIWWLSIISSFCRFV